MLVLLLLFSIVIPFPRTAVLLGEELDRFGGRPCERLEAGDRFRLESLDGRWWLVTPDGGRFLSFGVNHMAWNGDRAKGTGEMAYRDAVLAKFQTPDKWAKAWHGW